jgi:hypothetical protein
MNKLYKVSVDGQLDMPFESLEDAVRYSEHMEKEGFGCLIYKEEPTQ